MMTLRSRLLLAAIWFASLVTVGVWAQTPAQPQVISGADLGFRVLRHEPDGTPVGKLVVRVKGQWMDASFAGGLKKLGAEP